MSTHRLFRIAALPAALLVAACSGGGESSKVSENGTYLHVTAPDLYYSTINVGSVATETLEIQNRGGDRYPLKSIRVSGADADAFTTPIFGDIVLEPAQAVRIPISFEPLSAGKKAATFEVDYSTIVLVDESENEKEQTYYQATDLADQGDFRASAASFEKYLDSDPTVDVNKRRAAMRVPIVEEAVNYGDGRDATLYLDALAARDRSDPEDAQLALTALVQLESDSFLADDAQYLKGYIALMDMDDARLALREFKVLTDTFPDSTYYDTAQYGQAIAQERLGNDRVAHALYTDLRERHTGVSALGVDLPKDTLVSRLWFDRADAALSRSEVPL